MTYDKNQFYGWKIDRLLCVRNISTLRHLVLPIFPIAPLLHAVSADLAEADAIACYASALEQALPNLVNDIEASCGRGPWIVRSSGDEDSVDCVNAGGYESLICEDSSKLITCVAAVALSGRTEHATRQLALSGPNFLVDVVPCFVQPLLNISVCENIAHDHSPYLDTAVLAQMETICSRLMQIFDFDAIDCEWGLDTTHGFVSVTTVMPKDAEL